MKYKVYVKYAWVKKGEPQIASRVLGYADTLRAARAMFRDSEWLVKRVELPSTRNLRLCLAVEETAPEKIGVDPEDMYEFGNAYPDMDTLEAGCYMLTIRYAKKGTFGDPEDIGEKLLVDGKWESDMIKYIDANEEAIEYSLKTESESGLLDTPTLCLYYPTKHEDRKPRTKAQTSSDTEEVRETALL
jgi:hypothetical protein